MKTSVGSVALELLLAVVLLSTSLACGSQLNPTGPSSFAQQPSQMPQPVPLPQPWPDIVPASNRGVPGVYRRDLVMSRSGKAIVTLRWADGDYSLQLYVTSGACADAASLPTGGCSIVGRTRPGDLPGVVSSSVISGDLNTVWVVNPDPGPQSFSVDVDIR